MSIERLDLPAVDRQRWLPRVAAFVAGAVVGGLLATLVTHVVWPSRLAPLDITLLSEAAESRAAAVLALLCGLAATVCMVAWQSQHDTD